jgi:tRNA-dihydrouridine synthase B
MTLRLGPLELATNLALAPLAGYTDAAFRRAVRALGGLGLATTELVSPRGLLMGTGRSHEIAAAAPDDAPLAVQFYGTRPDEMARAAHWAADHGAAAIDINMGCPMRKITRHGGGAAILADPDAAVALAARVVEAVAIPVTVKMRLGVMYGNLVAPALAARLRDVGCAAITVHGRYAVQKYTGAVDLDAIRAVVEAARGIPIFGNGDVRSPEDARRMIEATGCAGVAIGRAALADPWIFRDTHALLTAGRVPDPPDDDERADFVWRHFRATVEAKGERRACIQFRKWIPRYARTLPRLRARRDLTQTLASAAELEGALKG